MPEKSYELWFRREKLNSAPDDELGHRYGPQRRDFTAFPWEIWYKVADFLLDESRRLKPNENIMAVMLADGTKRRKGGRGFGTLVRGDRAICSSFNVLLGEMTRLRRKIKKQAGRVSGRQSLRGSKMSRRKT